MPHICRELSEMAANAPGIDIQLIQKVVAVLKSRKARYTHQPLRLTLPSVHRSAKQSSGMTSIEASQAPRMGSKL